MQQSNVAYYATAAFYSFKMCTTLAPSSGVSFWEKFIQLYFFIIDTSAQWAMYFTCKHFLPMMFMGTAWRITFLVVIANFGEGLKCFKLQTIELNLCWHPSVRKSFGNIQFWEVVPSGFQECDSYYSGLFYILFTFLKQPL
jgi:hypothetical protein